MKIAGSRKLGREVRFGGGGGGGDNGSKALTGNSSAFFLGHDSPGL